MKNRRAPFTQSDITKVLKAYRDAGQPMPRIVIEPERITVSSVTDTTNISAPNDWD